MSHGPTELFETATDTFSSGYAGLVAPVTSQTLRSAPGPSTTTLSLKERTIDASPVEVANYEVANPSERNEPAGTTASTGNPLDCGAPNTDAGLLRSDTTKVLFFRLP